MNFTQTKHTRSTVVSTEDNPNKQALHERVDILKSNKSLRNLKLALKGMKSIDKSTISNIPMNIRCGIGLDKGGTISKLGSPHAAIPLTFKPCKFISSFNSGRMSTKAAGVQTGEIRCIRFSTVSIGSEKDLRRAKCIDSVVAIENTPRRLTANSLTPNMGLYKRKALPIAKIIKSTGSLMTTPDVAVSHRLPLPNEQLFNEFIRSKYLGDSMAASNTLALTARPRKFVGGNVKRKGV